MNQDPSQKKLLEYILAKKSIIQTEIDFNRKFESIFKSVLSIKIEEYSNLLSNEIGTFLKFDKNINNDGSPSAVIIRVFKKDQNEVLEKEKVPQLWITTNMTQKKLRFMEQIEDMGLSDIIQLDPNEVSSDVFSNILGTFLEKALRQQYD